MAAEITLSDTPRERSYTASAGQAVFPVEFAYGPDLPVGAVRIRSGLTETFAADQLTLAPAQGESGQVTLPTASEAGDLVVVFGDAPAARAAYHSGRVRTTALNADANRLLALIQEVRDELARTLRADRGTQMPPLNAEASSAFTSLLGDLDKFDPILADLPAIRAVNQELPKVRRVGNQVGQGGAVTNVDAALPTLFKLVNDPPVPYSSVASTTITSQRTTVREDDIIYRLRAVPYAAPAVFDPAAWEMLGVVGTVEVTSGGSSPWPNVMPPPPLRADASGTIRLLKNELPNGNSQPGTVGVVNGILDHPTLGFLDLRRDDFAPSPFESAIQDPINGVFWVIWSFATVNQRFKIDGNPDPNMPAGKFFCAEYDPATDTWYARGNGANSHVFTVQETDVAVAACFVDPGGTQIKHLVPLMASLRGTYPELSAHRQRLDDIDGDATPPPPEPPETPIIGTVPPVWSQPRIDVTEGLPAQRSLHDFVSHADYTQSQLTFAIVSGPSQVSLNADGYTLDIAPTLPAGAYLVRLRATDPDGNFADVFAQLSVNSASINNEFSPPTTIDEVLP